MLGTTTSSSKPVVTPAYRVLVVDDSAVIRGLIARALDGNPSIKVVATAANGELAIATLKREPVDVIILDIEMPVMDGLTAIPQLRAIDPGVQIVMASTLTQKNADISIKAMSLGAADYVPKPTTSKLVGTDAENFNRDLTEKVLALGELARRRGVRMGEGVTRQSFRPPEPAVRKPISLRPKPVARPEIIAIGSSTGGPQALFDVIKVLGKDLPQSIVITQHMPAAFTKILAEHITRQCGVSCKEAEDGEALKPGQYYLAPGDYHMLLVKKLAGGATVKLTKDPPENYCRPAVDPMLRSAVDVYGGRILTVILTGMGQDGWKGSEAVVNAGGGVIGQDEASSVVWGMPAAVANGGLCCAVLPLGEIGATVKQMATGGRG